MKYSSVLREINSMTKYPSILTYHKRGDRGKLLDEVLVPFDGPAILTEKIDGVNGRIIMFPDGLYIIGSREELLYGKGDLVGNLQLGIVDALKPIAERLIPSGVLTVYFFEVYGGTVTKNSKQYTGNKLVGARLFDVATVQNHDKILDMPIEKIAAWRDNGGQTFYNESSLVGLSYRMSLALTPRLGVFDIPTDFRHTYDWIGYVITTTRAALDNSALGRSECIVIRTADRSKIAKIRVEDYERTFRAK